MLDRLLSYTSSPYALNCLNLRLIPPLKPHIVIPCAPFSYSYVIFFLLPTPPPCLALHTLIQLMPKGIVPLCTLTVDTFLRLILSSFIALRATGVTFLVYVCLFPLKFQVLQAFVSVLRQNPELCLTTSFMTDPCPASGFHMCLHPSSSLGIENNFSPKSFHDLP